MILSFIFLFLPCFCSCVYSSRTRYNIIGEDPGNIKNVPYQLALERLIDNIYVQYCGAAIIHSEWAVTSAYCVSSCGSRFFIDEVRYRVGGSGYTSHSYDYGDNYDSRSGGGGGGYGGVGYGGYDFGGYSGHGGGSGRRGTHRGRVGISLTLQGTKIRVRSGSSHRETGGTLHNVEKIIIHPQYNPSNKDYDVALIKVSNLFVYSDSVQRIVMASESPTIGSLAVVSGWGGFSTMGLPSNVVQQAEITVMESDNCQESISLTPRIFCAAEGVCLGDVGGPLVADNRLSGIVSCNWKCGGPGMYTDVAKIRNWVISSILEEET